jgi:hypothetical protein
MSLVDEDLLTVEEPPVFRRTASDPPPDISAGAMGSDEGSFHPQDGTAEESGRTMEQGDHQSTPDIQQRLLSGLKNPSLARFGQEASPYTPVDLNAYLMNESHSTPTPSRVSPLGGSHHLLPPLSASSSRSHSPSHSNQSISPLPTLSELRNLQRANSAAGRLMAMKKLMGQTPPSPTSLRRAGSLNVGSRAHLSSRNTANGTVDDEDQDEDRSIELVDRGDDDEQEHSRSTGDQDLAQELNDFGAGMLGSPTKQTGAKRNPNRNRRLGSMDLLTRNRPEELEEVNDVGDDPPQPIVSAQDVTPPPSATRPRLGRSNTVGTGGGEERRSVIGRRMMERLGTRVARQDEGGALGGAAGLQALVQRAKERKEQEMLRLKDEAETLSRQQAEEAIMDEAGMDSEVGNASFENSPSDFDQPRFSDDLVDQIRADVVDRASLGDPPTAADTASVAEHRLAPPIIVENVVEEHEADTSPELGYEARQSIYNGRQSLEGALSSDSDHRRGSVAFLETSGSEDSHQRYRQHSPYFGIGQGISTAGAHSHNLFAASNGLARSVSARSGASDTFEYAAHLRRSGSEKRTTRGSTATPVPDLGDTVGDNTLEQILTSDDSGMGEDSIEEIQSPVETPLIETPPLGLPSGMRTPSDGRLSSDKSHVSPARSLQRAADYIGGDESLLPPLAPFATQQGDPHRDSTATQSGGKHSTTPSESSVGSALSAIPFFVSSGPENSLSRTPRLPADLMPIARRDMSMSSFPAGVHGDDDRSSGFGTPGRTYGTSMGSPSNTLHTATDSPVSAYTVGPETPKIARRQPSAEGSATNTHRRLGSAFEPRRMDAEVEELDEVASPAGHSIMS